MYILQSVSVTPPKNHSSRTRGAKLARARRFSVLFITHRCPNEAEKISVQQQEKATLCFYVSACLPFVFMKVKQRRRGFANL